MATPQIESYRFGQIVIDGQTYNKDVIVLPDGVRPNWWRTEGHRLGREDLDAVFEADLEVLVVGRGAFGRMWVPDEVGQAVREAGMALIAQPTKQAVATYNRLRGSRAIAAALHLTC